MMDFDGLPDMLQRLAALETRIVPAVTDAIDAETELILFHSQPLVPVDTGKLLSTGFAAPAQRHGDVIEGSVSYGGQGAADYAIIIHESVDMRHPRGGTHHFLSQKFYEATATMLTRFTETIRKSLGG